ncbi:hypothetical protein MRX96_028142 [Rhipicephalus microplus]
MPAALVSRRAATQNRQRSVQITPDQRRRSYDGGKRDPAASRRPFGRMSRPYASPPLLHLPLVAERRTRRLSTRRQACRRIRARSSVPRASPVSERCQFASTEEGKKSDASPPFRAS